MEKPLDSNPVAEIETPAQGMPVPEKNPYDSPEKRLLLLGALLIGAALRIFWDAPGLWPYGAFWLVAMGVFCWFFRDRLKGNKTALLIGGAGAALCLLRMVKPMNETLAIYQLPMIPLVMMLLLVFTAYKIPVKREGLAAKAVLRGFFVLPFTGIPACFGVLSSLGRGRKGKDWLPMLVGVGIGLPVMLLVARLLMSADAGMEKLVLRMQTELPVGEWLGDLVMIAAGAVLFYALFYNARWGERKETAARELNPAWTAGILNTVSIMVLLVYGLFIYVQFTYLFAGRLPEQTTYSAYAREGFFQLILAAGINFTLLGMQLRYGRPGGERTLLNLLLLFAVGVLLASGLTRLLLYIGAYGLTILRILPLWMMIYLTALTVMSLIRIFREGMPLLRIAALTLLVWYVLLHLPDWDAVIAG